jgi:hypothetical protein
MSWSYTNQIQIPLASVQLRILQAIDLVESYTEANKVEFHFDSLILNDSHNSEEEKLDL